MRKYSGIIALRKLPVERLFQLFVDGKLHYPQNGQHGFEKREPGCMQGFYNALTFALQNLDKPLTVNLLLQIHAAATRNVGGELFVLPNQGGTFRQTSMHAFQVDKNRCTPDGIKAICVREKLRRAERKIAFIRPPDLRVHIETQAGELVRVNLFDYDTQNIASDAERLYQHSQLGAQPFAYNPPSNGGEELAIAAEQIVQNYHRDIASAQDDKDLQLLAMVRCTQQLELLHPFVDANGRTFVNVMLNFLLMQNGFPPATFYEPNIFDLYAETELVDAVKDAMRHTLFSIENPDKPLFNFNARAIIVGEEKMMHEKLTEKLRATIASLLKELPVDDQDQDNEAIKLYLQTAWRGKMNAFHACAMGDINYFKTHELSQSEYYQFASSATTPLYKGCGLIHVACRMNQFDMVKHLLNVFPDLIRQPDQEGNTALHHAVQTDNVEMVKFLLEKGLDITLQDLTCAAEYGSKAVYITVAVSSLFPFQQNALVAAVRGNRFETVRWIMKQEGWIKNPATILGKITADNWHEILAETLKNRNADLFRFLWGFYFETEPNFDDVAKLLIDFVLCGDVSLLTFALTSDILESKRAPIPYDVFMMAARTKGSEAIFLKLIEIEDNLEDVVGDSSGEEKTVLHLAVLANNLAFVQAILAKDFPVDLSDVRDRTALDYARVLNANQAIINTLIQATSTSNASLFSKSLKKGTDSAVAHGNTSSTPKPPEKK